jgi:hypothetical protein
MEARINEGQRDERRNECMSKRVNKYVNRREIKVNTQTKQ